MQENALLEIQTDRLKMICLDYEALRLAWEDFQQVEAFLGLASSEFILDQPVRRAITLKLPKMWAQPEAVPWSTYWLIVLAESQQAIGLVGFKGSPDFQGCVEIGYGMQEKFRGNGYMSEAAGSLVDWALAQPNCRRVTAETEKNNLASQHVLQRLGFRMNGETHTTYWWFKEAMEV